ncbi:hypothetical protein CGRA01v4_12979 [Colletotrichum graminicola]|uniref:Circumsporozoite protein n=1 Tax=Colletotrichum graminicola (strain M1.001 / M2 / FGSC 10212) TaxID=645133 RepID=E3QJ65_COLGM|nr:uncharacterized protein GLRG_06047 [Colletotrichum graminicola M1.001]EFQ30903.1 hypothetical protein GLRG_06047 [Colletotrichum graminicola M1.001]WDK21689.1 hypothetical protein CGRA01v4_12979 [Colletotrichum graminicola]
MSSTKLFLISAILACVEARFGQENVPTAAIASLQAGSPGEAATLSGSVPGTLLAAADPCAKLKLADQVAALGTGDDVLAAAKGLVAAEQNFNPFVVSVPNICGDASLPATQALRGIVPLVDPSVGGSDLENANSKTSLTSPFDATGLSVADVMKAQGFSNFTVKGAAAGGAAAGGAAAGGAAAGGNGSAGNNNQNKDQNKDKGNNNASTGNNNDNAADDCNGGAAAGGAAAGNSTAEAGNDNQNNKDQNKDQDNDKADAGNNNNNNNNDAGAGAAAGGAAAGGAADFGKCTPTIDFQLGRPGRKATEGTFLPTDPLVAQGQQDALNPNIITNRVCDQLTNVCGANAAAKSLCKSAQAQILASGDKSADVATKFNSLLGF